MYVDSLLIFFLFLYKYTNMRRKINDERCVPQTKMFFFSVLIFVTIDSLFPAAKCSCSIYVYVRVLIKKRIASH